MIEEQIFALCNALSEQHKMLLQLYDARATLEAVLSRLVDAASLYANQRGGDDDGLSLDNTA